MQVEKSVLIGGKNHVCVPVRIIEVGCMRCILVYQEVYHKLQLVAKSEG